MEGRKAVRRHDFGAFAGKFPADLFTLAGSIKNSPDKLCPTPTFNILATLHCPLLFQQPGSLLPSFRASPDLAEGEISS
jgi:hypothetical protein